jgi:transcription antitermination factor NusG
MSESEERRVEMQKRTADSGHPWFALRVRSRYEKLVATMAREKGFEEFTPFYRSRRRWSDRFKHIDLPLFPGYLFCRVDPENRLPLLVIPGVLHFVGIGKVPAPIDSAEIAAIRSAVQSGLSAEPWPFLQVGQRVRLEAGPLAGLEGLLIEARKQVRIVVSVSLLNRSVAVEIERQWVTPLDQVSSLDLIRRDLASQAVASSWVQTSHLLSDPVQ